MHWGKNSQTFGGLLDNVSELALIQGDPNHHCGPQVRAGAYGCQVTNVVLAWVHLTMSPVGFQCHGYFSK